MHVALTILVSLAVIVVTAMLFIGWLGVVVVRGLFKLIAPKRLPIPRVIRARLNQSAGMVVRCSRESCQNFNPPYARFCRCCGAQVQAAAIRRPMDERRRVRVTA